MSQEGRNKMNDTRRLHFTTSVKFRDADEGLEEGQKRLAVCFHAVVDAKTTQEAEDCAWRALEAYRARTPSKNDGKVGSLGIMVGPQYQPPSRWKRFQQFVMDVLTRRSKWVERAYYYRAAYQEQRTLNESLLAINRDSVALLEHAVGKREMEAKLLRSKVSELAYVNQEQQMMESLEAVADEARRKSGRM